MAEDDKDDREDELEGGRMPLLDHLIELRNRLLWSFGAIIVAWAVCYYFSQGIYRFLAHPLAVIYAGEPGRKMIFTALTEAFFTYLKVSFWAAICLSFPIIASQLWKFVAPGLYKQERRAFLPYLCATPVLFAMGASLAYFVPLGREGAGQTRGRGGSRTRRRGYPHSRSVAFPASVGCRKG